MTIACEVLAHSCGPMGRKVQEIISYRIVCPAFIHQEQLRHRSHSFSVSSMRAIPLAKQVQQCFDDMAEPFEWGKAKPGMQPGELLNSEELKGVRYHWRSALLDVLRHVDRIDSIGAHKSLTARLLQPWSHYEMVVTSCWPGLANFFALRCHRKADPTIRRLAVRMADAFRRSEPQVLEPGWWHLPYVTEEELATLHDARRSEPQVVVNFVENTLLKLSVARCGRVSFLQHGVNEQRVEKDLKFHDDRLRDGDFSVFEPQARVPYEGEDFQQFQGNLPNFVQYRQTLQPNIYTDFDFDVLDRDFAGDLA